MPSSLGLALLGHILLFVSLAPKPPKAIAPATPMEVEIWVDQSAPTQSEELEADATALPTEVPSNAYPEPRESTGPGPVEGAGSSDFPSQEEEGEQAEEGRVQSGSWDQIDPSRILALGGMDAELLDAPKGPRRDRDKSPVERGIDQALAEFANEVPHLSERPPPTLALQSDGSLRYKGAGIEVVVGTDGSVDFLTPDAVTARVASEGASERLLNKEKRRKWIEEVYGGQVVVDCRSSGPTDSPNDVGCGGRGPSTVPLVTGSFDTCAFEPRDCYSYEKRWFMKETEKLRKALHQRWRQVNLRRSLYELEVALVSLETDASLGLAQKRDQLQQLLADCADNWEGEQSRLMIHEVLERLERTEYARVPDAGSGRPDAGPG